jgi:tetratricopeptide (TPR) repeat protein
MAGRMFRFLTILGLAAGLGACASESAAPPLAARAPDAATPALSADPDASPYGLFLAGEVARDAGHLTAANFYLGRAAAAEGEPSYLKSDAFTAALQAGDVPGAAALMPDAADPNDQHLAVLVRGVEAMAEDKDKDAYLLFTGPDIDYPPKAAALLLAPFAAAGAGDTAHALANPDFDGDNVSQFVAALDHAELLERYGKLQPAEALFKAMIAGGDDSGLVTSAYGDFLERHGRWADAAALFQTRLARNPDDGAATAALARTQKRVRPPPLPSVRQGAAGALLIPAAALVSQKQDVLALDYLRLALRLDPASDEGWVLLGDLLAPADVDGARAAYANVSPKSDAYVSARGKLALTYQNAGDHETALKLARETLAAAPYSRDAAVSLADLLRSDDQYTESVAVLTKLIDAPGATPDWRIYYLRASSYDEIGDAARTQADLDMALKQAPNEPELLNFQGYFWIDRGEHLKDALNMVQRAAAAEPQSGEIVDSLGWAYYRLGDYKNAVEKLEQAITLDPSIPEVNDHLGDAYWRVGRKVEAQFQWRRVLSLAPDAKLKARAEAELASPLGPDAPPTPAAPPANSP